MPLVEDASCSIQPSGSSNTITLRDNDNNDEAKTTRGEDTEWEETGGGYGNRKTQSGGAARPALMEEVRAKLAEPAVNPMNLHLRDTPDRGRGVFASHPIPTGTLVEESPVLVLSKSEWENGKLDGTLLGSHGFCWSNGGMAIGLGLGTSAVRRACLELMCRSFPVQPLEYSQCELHSQPLDFHHPVPDVSLCRSRRGALHLLFAR